MDNTKPEKVNDNNDKREAVLKLPKAYHGYYSRYNDFFSESIKNT